MAKTELELARLDLVNAQAAIESLPVIEERARARVEDSRARLGLDEAELTRVLETEIPAAHARVKELEAHVTDLSQQAD